MAIAKGQDDLSLQVETQIHLGMTLSNLGDFRQVTAFGRQALAALEGTPVTERLGQLMLPSVSARFLIALALAEMGAFTESMAYSEESVRLAEMANQPYSLARAYVGLGSICLCKGECQRSVAIFERCLELFQAANLSMEVVIVTPWLGYAYAFTGRFAEALPLLEQAVEQATEQQSHSFFRLGSTRFSEGIYLAGHLHEASDLANRALDLAHTCQERSREAYTLRLLGDIAMHRDPPDTHQAETHYHQALTLATELGMRPLQAHCHRGLGTLYRQTGQSAHARAKLSMAIDMSRDMDMTFWLPETEAALAEVEKR